MSNRDAVGARMELYWNGQKQRQEVTAASGFSAQNGRRLHFGIGASDRVDRVVIRWPSGDMQTIEAPAIDQLHHIREPQRATAAAPVTLAEGSHAG